MTFESEDTSVEPDEVWTGSGEEDEIQEAPTDEQWLAETATPEEIAKSLTDDE